MDLLFVMMGGFIGAILRFATGEMLVATATTGEFPTATLTVNLVGCFALGYLLTYASHRKNVPPRLTLLLGTGLLGSFTTFSSFSIETVQLFQNGKLVPAILYIAASILLGLLLSFFGMKTALTHGRKEGQP